MLVLCSSRLEHSTCAQFFWNTAPYTFIDIGHNPEDSSNSFLRKDEKFLPDFTASHPEKQYYLRTFLISFYRCGFIFTYLPIFC